MKKVQILETTLRDGSYTVNNQFNINDTAVISKNLEEIGFEYIEVGPGIGLNAGSHTDIKPAFSDMEYIKAAKNSVAKAKIGMFFIPGTGSKKDLTKAKEAGLDFVRIGTNITEYKNSFEYIKFANELGFITTLNLMKSYVVNSDEFKKIAKACYENGVKILYLVDSAGGMLPSEVYEYIKETKDFIPQLKLGFHGHDNLSLSIANSLEAVKAGAEFVDSTMRGIGRSSGNAVTEKLVLTLERLGYNLNIDKEKLYDLSEKVILPYIIQKHENSSDYVSGYAQFHSSYLNSIDKVAKKYSVSKNQLIIEYSQIDKINMDENTLENLAKKMKKEEKENINSLDITAQINYKENNEEQLLELKHRFIELKNKYNVITFFNITKAYSQNKGLKVSPVIHSVKDVVFGSAEINRIKENFNSISDLDDVVDGFLVDNRLFSKDEIVNNKKMYYYDDALLMARSIYNYMQNIILKENYKDIKLFIDIYEEVYYYFINLIKEFKVNIVKNINEADVAIVGKNYIRKEDVSSKNDIKWLLLTVPGMIDPYISKEIFDFNMIRLDLKNELFGEIIESINYKELLNNKYGIRKIDGKKYCSGGYIGQKGTVIVDNINNIKKEYGLSNGDGSIDYF